MLIRPVDPSDWDVFMRLALDENWTVSFLEQRLFQNQWRPYFHVLWSRGRRCGFVSAVIYGSSAWIGNLIVRPELRRHGYGSRLFLFALERLRGLPALKRIWLTASEQGAPLYLKHGFRMLDRVDRWIACGTGGNPSGRERPVELGRLIEYDGACWGESRTPLLEAAADDGFTISAGRSLALLQAGIGVWQLGPWLSRERSPLDDRTLLDKALAATPRHKLLVTDVIALSGAGPALGACGFEWSGSNALMCLSREPVALDGCVALASLGSLG